jgi:hypothetical protein
MEVYWKPYTDRLANLLTEITGLAALIDDAELPFRPGAYLHGENSWLGSNLLAEYRNDSSLAAGLRRVRHRRSPALRSSSPTPMSRRSSRGRMLYVLLAAMVAMLDIGLRVPHRVLDAPSGHPRMSHSLGWVRSG